jgi:hypothetical protein
METFKAFGKITQLIPEKIDDVIMQGDKNINSS